MIIDTAHIVPQFDPLVKGEGEAMHRFPAAQSGKDAKSSPSFTFPALFTLTETAVSEYNRIDGLYHEWHE
ncbi:MAG: hypothetical protein ACI4WX_10985 [Aristaeellaceae bacterium]